MLQGMAEIPLPAWLPILSVIAAMIAAIGVIGNSVLSFVIHTRLVTYHLEVNSRVDQLITEIRNSAHAAGVREEQDRKLIQV
jgi:hypothetical protein